MVNKQLLLKMRENNLTFTDLADEINITVEELDRLIVKHKVIYKDAVRLSKILKLTEEQFNDIFC